MSEQATKLYFPPQVAALICFADPEKLAGKKGQELAGVLPMISYRPPQSAPVMPAIYLTPQDEEVLRTFGKLRLQETTQGWHFGRRSDESAFGCCGDCEQGLLNNYIEAIQQVLGRRQVSRPMNAVQKHVVGEAQLRVYLREKCQMEEMFIAPFIFALGKVYEKLNNAVIQQNRTQSKWKVDAA